MGVTIRTELVVNYQLGQNITVKDYKRNNVTHQTDNTITIYNETTKEVYIQARKNKLKSSSNSNIEKPDIQVAKLKQEIQIKGGNQEARKLEILKRAKEK